MDSQSAGMVYFVSRHECHRGYFGPKDKVLRARAIKHVDVDTNGDTWEHVRYLIEKHMGLHDKHASAKPTGRAYVDGWLYDATNPHPLESRTKLQKQEWINVRSCIIVHRHPTHKKPYVPRKFAAAAATPNATDETLRAESHTDTVEAYTEANTEEDKLMELVNRLPHQSRALQFRGPRAHHRHIMEHPADEINRPPPPEHYVCFRCGQPGHWKSECPTLDDPSFRSLEHVKPTTGIPKSFLRAAKDDDELKHAMYDIEGNLVVLASGTPTTTTTHNPY